MYSSHQAPRCWLSSMSVNLLYQIACGVRRVLDEPRFE